MTTIETIALAGVTMTALGGLGWLGSLTYHGGRQAQKLDSAIKDIGDLKETQAEHAKSIGVLEQLVMLVTEMRQDIKALIGKPTRRNSVSGD